MFDRVAFAYWYCLRFVQTFAANVGRRNDYFWPGKRAGLFFALWLAHLIAATCASIATGRTWSQLPEVPRA